MEQTDNKAPGIDGSTTQKMPPQEEDGESSSVTGYIADISQHATRSVEEGQQQQKQRDTSALVHGSFGVSTSRTSVPVANSPAPSAAAATEEETVVSDETRTSREQEAEPFVNHGLEAWEQNRRKWLKRENHEKKQQQHAIELNADEIIDVIFTSPRQLRMNGGVGRRFPQNVPLPQMVDILQDLWEAEGLDV